MPTQKQPRARAFKSRSAKRSSVANKSFSQGGQSSRIAPPVVAALGLALLAGMRPARADSSLPAVAPIPNAPTASNIAMRLKAGRLRFVVIDTVTHRPVAGAQVIIEDAQGKRLPQRLLTGLFAPAPTLAFDPAAWKTNSASRTQDTDTNLDANIDNAPDETGVTTIAITAGTTLTLQTQSPSRQPQTNKQAPLAQKRTGSQTSANGAQPNAPTTKTTGNGQTQTQTPGQPPVRDITIIVRASLLRRTEPTPSVVIQPNKNPGGAQGNSLIGGGKVTGVSSDSAGQQHVRGEHAEIAYVVDGVLLPDTLSGRQGAIVAASTIQSLAFLSGAYAPEFGEQTAAILDITTLPGARKPHADVNFQGGSYDTTNGDLTWEGPLGKYASYVFNVEADRSRNALEPQQPDNQTAHNAGSDQSYFGKFRYTPSRRDTLTMTLSSNPSTLQINNRTGLSSRFAPAGQGFGYLGLRNQNGTRPDAITDPADPNYNGDLLGAGQLQIGSQQQAGQDITQREINEFAVLNFVHRLSSRDTGQASVTFLHSGQDVRNQNPGVDLLNLPTDSSIEYSPVAVRNAHHVQFTGSLTFDRGRHRYKTGLLLDDQTDNESYQLTPGSRLALDELAAIAPNLAPAGGFQPQLNANGTPMQDAKGNAVYVKDVNGNPVYNATSAAIPNLNVHRSGFYRAAFAQDTWRVGKRLTANYGLRGDWYKQSQGLSVIDTATLSPRVNLSYALDGLTSLRASYNRLFNTPPLAQGAIIGAAVLPEILDQYDVSIQRQLGPTQTVSLAYYYKNIRNQVDTGLLIPGSQIGIYSAVNFQFGAVHGLEFAYDVAPKKGRSGLDSYINYTNSTAAPNGLDNTGAPAPTFNDHDQRNTLGVGLGYDWGSGANVGLTLEHGSGLASSIIPPSVLRTPRTQVNFHTNLAPRAFNGRGGLSFDVINLLDDRTVINFESGFSGTRFQQGRRVLLSLTGSF